MIRGARYYSYKQFLNERFGEPVLKLPIDAGFSCPNRDGTVGTGGCTYCLNKAFVPRYCSSEKNILQQIKDGIDFHRQRGRESKGYLAYFQAFSNTHAPLGKLRELYETVLSHPQVKGLIIGTRPDCVDEKKLDYIASLKNQAFISIEYGIESCHDRTLQRINRGHDFACTRQAIEATAARGIRVGGHIIMGLPGETKADMLAEADILSDLPLTTLKLHQLQLIKGTRMAEEYADCPEDFIRFTAEEYADLVVEFIRRSRPDLVFERFVSQSPPQLLAEPGWGLKNYEFMELVKRRIEEPHHR